LAGLGCLCGAELAADTTTIRVDPGLSRHDISSYYNNQQASVWAGSFNATIVDAGDPRPEGYPDTWMAFCMDLRSPLVTRTAYEYEAKTFAEGNPPDGGPHNPAWLMDGGHKAAYLYNTFLSQVTSGNSAAAMAIAIWEVLYDTGENVSANGLNAQSGYKVLGDTAVVNLAQGWLNAAAQDQFGFADGIWDYSMTWWAEADPRDPQSLLGPMGPGYTPTPEPAEYVLLGLSLAGIAFGYQRVRRGKTFDAVAGV
jgi:hypothetical protein